MTGRLLLGAPFSGAGKTTATMALLAGGRRRGLTVQPFKVGPDFLDPRFHERTTSRRSHNLDPWMLAPDALRRLVARASVGADLSVIEGVMGLYDGLEYTDRCSSAQVARDTGTPVVLIVPARGIARSMAALVKGYADFWSPTVVKGVLFTRVGGQSHAALLRRACEDLPLPLVGWLPELPDCRLDHRQLGLIPPNENDMVRMIDQLGEAAEAHVDWPVLLALAESAERLAGGATGTVLRFDGLRLGLAHDEAFDADYPAALDDLASRGVTWVPFSPLSDRLPEGLDGLWIRGGGSLRLAARLSANAAFAADLRGAVAGGLPLWAEGLGAACLAQRARTEDDVWPLWGVLDGTAVATERRAGFGYVRLEGDGLEAGFRAHEFRYWDWENGRDEPNVTAVKERRDGAFRWPGGFVRPGLVAIFGHSHPLGVGATVDGFLRSCRDRRESRPR